MTRDWLIKLPGFPKLVHKMFIFKYCIWKLVYVQYKIFESYFIIKHQQEQCG